jgi:pyruvate,water dikinase
VCIAGIVSASVVPDTYAQTKQDIHELERENIQVRDLGDWLKKQHFSRLVSMLEKERYGHIIKHNNSAEELLDWYEGELRRLHEQVQNNLGTAKEDFYRQELDSFRKRLHKPVIYANWDWNRTVNNALYQAGFESFEEQEQALEEQRNKTW